MDKGGTDTLSDSSSSRPEQSSSHQEPSLWQQREPPPAENQEREEAERGQVQSDLGSASLPGHTEARSEQGANHLTPGVQFVRRFTL